MNKQPRRAAIAGLAVAALLCRIFTLKTKPTMKNYVPAPKSDQEFVDLLLSGETVSLKTGSLDRPVKLIDRLNDAIARREGVFESDTRLVTQVVMDGDVAPMWDADFRDPTENIRVLFWVEGLMKEFPPVKLPLGIRSGKEYSLYAELAVKLIDGKTVFVAGCKNPKAFLFKMETIIPVSNIESKPVYNGQGRELGKMTMPEDDEPTGYSFKIVRHS
jgi:hypothetical protein